MWIVASPDFMISDAKPDGLETFPLFVLMINSLTRPLLSRRVIATGICLRQSIPIAYRRHSQNFPSHFLVFISDFQHTLIYYVLQTSNFMIIIEYPSLQS